MTDVVSKVAAQVVALTAPIPGPEAAGVDLSFDAEFEQVKAEMDKVGSIASLPDWEKVITLSAKLLGNRTKDMRLATWFAVAKMHKQGWPGLAEGLVVLRAHVTTYWDTMFPARRPRARANLFGWLTEQVAAFFEPRPGPTLADAEALRASEVLFKEIDVMLAEKLGEMHPGQGTIRGLIASRIAAIPAPEPEGPGVDPPTQSPTVVAAPANGAPGAPAPAPPRVVAPVAAAQTIAKPSVTVSTIDGVKEALGACREAIVSAAWLLFKADHTNAYSYHLHRVGAWLAIREAPPVEGVKTFVRGPDARTRAGLEQHHNAARWMPLLRQAEELVSQYIFWLDPHRYVALALQALGPECADAARIVTRAVGSLVDRLPVLPSLLFSDGAPFASAETQAWVDASRAEGGASAGGGVKEALAEEAREQDKRLDAARQSIQEGRIGEGIGLMIALARRAPDGRVRFRLELDAATLAMEAQKPGIARPILEGLVRQIDAHSLEAWDPELCVMVYAALLNATRAIKPPIVDALHREAVIIEKICRLDPAMAVRLGI